MHDGPVHTSISTTATIDARCVAQTAVATDEMMSRVTLLVGPTLIVIADDLRSIEQFESSSFAKQYVPSNSAFVPSMLYALI